MTINSAGPQIAERYAVATANQHLRRAQGMLASRIHECRWLSAPWTCRSGPA
jgi:hypothetical protein